MKKFWYSYIVICDFDPLSTHRIRVSLIQNDQQLKGYLMCKYENEPALQENTTAQYIFHFTEFTEFIFHLNCLPNLLLTLTSLQI